MTVRSARAKWIFLLTLFVFNDAASTWGHSPDEGNTDKAEGHDHSRVNHHDSETLLLPRLGDAKPWSSAPVLNDASRFQFAVVTDRTGGHRPGIWMQAVRSLNLLRPEFVVSVGDLIEGYTEDLPQIHKEWKEFLGFIDQLEMRFFFVAGNHDVTNPTLHQIWRDHFGKEWYSFDYKGVHFLCLLSEDPTSRIGQEQLAWAIDDLAANQDARWTFVFIHKPLWVYAERELAAGNADNTNWKTLEAKLSSRPHTVFAGHVHHYVQYKRNGYEYYSLATTGGGSRLRGKAYGEFDQFVWVTMEQDGPRIANVMLDGVLASDVVTEASIQRFRAFLNQTTVRVEPVLVESGETIQAAELKITVTNAFDDAILVDAQLEGVPLKGLTVEPERLTASITPHETKQATCRFRFERPVRFDVFRNVTLTAKIKTDTESPLTAEVTVPVMVDRRHQCPELAVTVDGELAEWPAGPVEIIGDQATTLGAAQQWQGAGDASMRFQVAHDAEHVYFSGRVQDDVVVTDRDSVMFSIDARPKTQRIANPSLGEHAYFVEIKPVIRGKDASGSVATIRTRRDRSDGQLKGALRLVPLQDGYAFEMSIPKTLLTNAQGEDWSDFQMNAVLLDIDEGKDENVYVHWHPVRDLRKTNTNYGYFFRASKP